MLAAPVYVLARYTLPRSSTAQYFQGRWCFAFPQKTTSFCKWPSVGFATSGGLQKKTERFNPILEDGEINTHTPSKWESPRAGGGKISFRSVAVEAEKTRRDYILGTGKNRFVDPKMVTKKVRAYCATEQYNISLVVHVLEENGLKVDPFQTRLYPQVVHAQIKPGSVFLEKSRARSEETGDIFVFPSGTVVTWNVPERAASNLVTKILSSAASSPHISMVETENMGYLEDPKADTSSIIGDTIILGTGFSSNVRAEIKSNTKESLSAVDGDASRTMPPQNSEVDIILARVAFSSGLARSTKLAALESLLSRYFESTRDIPKVMSRGKRLPFTRTFVLSKTGELLSIRAQLNLYSELTDSLPDMFWDSRQDLGLEGYYDEVGRALDVGHRIKTLNEKMDYAQEIATVLRAKLSESHGLFLEWLIIALISVEVILEFWRRYNEKEEKLNPNSTESLLRHYLQKELKKAG